MPRDDYGERVEARRERLLRGAERARNESDTAASRARAVVEHIPLGQPILVGHHSERKHRSALRRADQAMTTAVERGKDAERLERAAESVGKGGISSDDPEALVKLREKLAGMEQWRETMKAVNKAWRRGGFEAVQAANLLPSDALAKLKADLQRTWRAGDPPFPAYKLSNLGGNITRVRARIDQMEAERSSQSESSEPKTTLVGTGYRVIERPDLNRVTIVFDERPSREVCQQMRHYGFKYSPREAAWMRNLNNAGRSAAVSVTTAVEGLVRA